MAVDVKGNLWLLLVFLLVSVVFVLPVFPHLSDWGFNDWDQHMFYHGSAAVSLLKYHQFPLWNPFYCGGSVLLSNPQSTFLSPFFVFVLLFGAVVGLKLEIIAYLVLGLFGMYKLSRKLGIQGFAAFFPGVIFMFSGWFSLHVAEGHTTFLPFALLPFALFFYLCSFDDLKNIVFCALALVLMIFAGGVYPFYYSVIILGAFAFFDFVQKRSFKPLLVVAAVFLLAFLLGSVKLVPMLDVLRGPGEAPDVEYNRVSFLYNALFSRTQLATANNVWTGFDAVPLGSEKLKLTFEGKLPWGWHEYGAYVGVIPFVFFLLSLFAFRRCWQWILLSFVFLLLSLGDFSPVPLWSLLQHLPFFGSLHGPSRFIVPFVFCLSILAGIALSNVKQLKSRHVQLALVALVAVDLFLVSFPVWSDAFTNEPIEVNTYDYWDYTQIVVTGTTLNMYSNMLQNLGTWNCYERVHPKIKARPQFFDTGDPYEGFIGPAYFADNNQSFNVSFSPNRMTVGNLSTNVSRILVLNQNYLSGWKVEGREVFPYTGLVAANITPADRAISFYYRPGSVVAGVVISLLSLAGVIAFLLCSHRRRIP